MYDLPKNLKLFTVIRRSKDKQHDSIERQRDLVQMLLKQIDAVQYAELVLDDHSATAGAQWEALYRIIERKRCGEHFEGVCASEYARVGRHMDDCEEYHRALTRAKLILVTHKEGPLTGRDKWITRNAAAHSNEKYAEAISVNMNGGLMMLIKRRIIPHVQTPTFGIDRLHISMITGKPLFRLRWTRDDRVLRLDPNNPDPSNPICEYAGTERDNFPRRQKDEKVVLVPGDEEELKTIREIFQLYFLEGCGYSEIGDRLNARMIKSPTGRDWEFYSVRAILLNYSYTGIGRCCVTGNGVHSLRDKNGPKLFGTPRNKEEDERGMMRSKVTQIRRTPDEWYVTRCPALLHILPKQLRRTVKATNRRRRRNALDMTRVEGIRRSTFFLSGQIYAAETETKLYGIVTKFYKGKPFRYYYVNRTGLANKRISNEWKVKSIPAELLENTFIELIRMVVCNQAGLRDTLTSRAKARFLRSQNFGGHLTELVKERQTHEEHLKMIIAMGPGAQKYALDTAKKLTQRIEELQCAIAAERQPEAIVDEADIPKFVDNVLKSLAEVERKLGVHDPKLFRQIARLLVSRIEFCGATCKVKFRLRLPSRLIAAPDFANKFFYTRGNPRAKNTVTAKNADAVFLGVFVYALERGTRRTPAQLTYCGIEPSEPISYSGGATA